MYKQGISAASAHQTSANNQTKEQNKSKHPSKTFHIQSELAEQQDNCPFIAPKND